MKKISHKWLKLIMTCLISLIFMGSSPLVSLGKEKINSPSDYSFSIPEFSLTSQSSPTFSLELQPVTPLPELKPEEDSTPIPLIPKSDLIKKPPHPETFFKPYLQTEKIENAFFTSTLITLSLLNVADFLSTNKALQYEGLQEGNPLLQPLVKNKVAFGVVKAGLTYLNYQLLKKVHRHNKTVGWILSTLSNAVMGYVVWHNLKMIKKAQAHLAH